MALVLRFRSRVLLPTVWITEPEWRKEFGLHPMNVLPMLDASGATVLEDCGGFSGIVTDVAWARISCEPSRVCSRCGVLKIADDFYYTGAKSARRRAECRACDNARWHPKAPAASASPTS